MITQSFNIFFQSLRKASFIYPSFKANKLYFYYIQKKLMDPNINNNDQPKIFTNKVYY
jgi:hypothetical protein